MISFLAWYIFPVVTLIGLISAYEKRPLFKTLTLMVMISASLMAHIFLMSLSPIWIFKTQTTNWQGQILSFLLFFCISLLFRKPSLSSTGFRFCLQNRFILEAFLIGFSMALLSVILTGGFKNINSLVERFAYQMTMPGISEEFIYRGFLLSLLNAHFGMKFSFLKTNFGWGLFLVSVPFMSAHLISFSGTIEPFFIATSLFVFIGSFLLGYLRERSGSLVPAIIAHNTSNTVELAIVCARRLIW